MKDNYVFIPSSVKNIAGNNIFTRKFNACNKLPKWIGGKVVEYKLVPTGREYDCNGDLIDE